MKIHWPGPADRRSPILAALSLLALAVGTLGICGTLVLRGEGPAPSPDPNRSMQVAAKGLVEGASREVAIFPEVSGILAVIHVTVNQDVEAGTLLCELRNEPQKAQVALAEADLAFAEARLQHAKADWDRTREVRRRTPGAISEQAYDSDHYRWRSAQAQQALAQARLRLALAELAKTHARAPIAGRILQIHGERGTLVELRENPIPVLRLADVTRRRVRAWVEELDMAQVVVGQRAIVLADGLAGQEFAGKVVEIAGRMGRDAPPSHRPGEQRDLYFREVVIELESGQELPLNLRVDVLIDPQTSPHPAEAVGGPRQVADAVVAEE